MVHAHDQYEFYYEVLYTPNSPVGYRPVLLMHGIADNYKSMEGMVTFIKDAHPGTPVYNIDAFNDAVSSSLSNEQLAVGNPSLGHPFDELIWTLPDWRVFHC